MKTRIYLLMLAFFMFASLSANAQARYSAEVDLGYSLTFEKYGVDLSDRINLTTTHGVMFNERLFVGAGVALDYFYSSNGDWFMMPLYGNVKGFLPLSEKTSLFASVDVGYSLYLSGEDTVGSGAFYCCPSVGLKLNSFKLQVGYDILSFSGGVGSESVGAIQFKVGFMF